MRSPILYHIQSAIIDFLKQDPIGKTLSIFNIFNCSFDEWILRKISSAQPLQLGIGCPFPIETCSYLSVPSWRKLALTALLIQRNHSIKTNNFIDLAEQLSFSISHTNFSTERCQWTFVLNEKQPWQWLELKNKTALQIHFTTQDFSTFDA